MSGMSRKKLEDIVWEHAPQAYRTHVGQHRAILMMRACGPTAIPLSKMTPAELLARAPKSVQRAAKDGKSFGTYLATFAAGYGTAWLVDRPDHAKRAGAAVGKGARATVTEGKRLGTRAKELAHSTREAYHGRSAGVKGFREGRWLLDSGHEIRGEVVSHELHRYTIRSGGKLIGLVHKPGEVVTYGGERRRVYHVAWKG